jgi:hypothetical protein
VSRSLLCAELAREPAHTQADSARGRPKLLFAARHLLLDLLAELGRGACASGRDPCSASDGDGSDGGDDGYLGLQGCFECTEHVTSSRTLLELSYPHVSDPNVAQLGNS